MSIGLSIVTIWTVEFQKMNSCRDIETPIIISLNQSMATAAIDTSNSKQDE